MEPGCSASAGRVAGRPGDGNPESGNRYDGGERVLILLRKIWTGNAGRMKRSMTGKGPVLSLTGGSRGRRVPEAFGKPFFKSPLR